MHPQEVLEPSVRAEIATSRMAPQRQRQSARRFAMVSASQWPNFLTEAITAPRSPKYPMRNRADRLDGHGCHASMLFGLFPAAPRIAGRLNRRLRYLWLQCQSPSRFYCLIKKSRLVVRSEIANRSNGTSDRGRRSRNSRSGVYREAGFVMTCCRLRSGSIAAKSQAPASDVAWVERRRVELQGADGFLDRAPQPAAP